MGQKVRAPISIGISRYFPLFHVFERLSAFLQRAVVESMSTEMRRGGERSLGYMVALWVDVNIQNQSKNTSLPWPPGEMASRLTTIAHATQSGDCRFDPCGGHLLLSLTLFYMKEWLETRWKPGRCSFGEFRRFKHVTRCFAKEEASEILRRSF